MVQMSRVKATKTYAITLVASVICNGCGTNIDATPTLRMACPGFTDQQIETIASAILAEKEQGTTYANVLQGTAGQCDSSFCSICLTAVINQVYGR